MFDRTSARKKVRNWYNLSSGNIQVVEEFPEYTIVSKLNEYIDVDNPLDELNIDNIKTY